MRKKWICILIIVSVSFLALRYLILKPAYSYLSGYLSKSQQVKADILIVEGWLPGYALQMACDEFQRNGYKYVITTGIISIKPYYKMSDNGYLIFYPGKELSGKTEHGLHTIEVKAYSDMGGENRAHFNLYINDSLTANFYTDRLKRGYRINWQGSLDKIDSVMIQYDNDQYETYLDRNLSVKEIRFDGNIVVPYLFHSEYDMLKLDGKLRSKNNVISTARFAKESLMLLGIDSCQITEMSAEKVSINRTLTSALDFRSWLAQSEKDIKGINIITLGTHARRTWMTYNKILDEKYAIGIISLPDSNEQVSTLRKGFRTLRETLQIIYYWFILIPY